MGIKQENIHYRIGGKLTHCGVECLPQGNDIESIVIASIEYKEKESINGRTELGVWIAYFAENPYTKLPFILNSTNRKRLVKLFPECDGYLARLHNITVRLTKERCRDVQDGGETWGLRISKIKPTQVGQVEKKEILIDKVPSVIEWAKKNSKHISDIEAYYTMSDAVRNAIIDGLGD